MVLKAKLLNLVFKRMAKGYQEQKVYYQKMLEVAREQEVVLNEEEVNMEKLFNLIEQRQELMVTLDKMNVGLVDLKKEIRDALGIEEFKISSIQEKITGPGVKALADVLGELKILVEKLKKVDQKNEITLRKVMQKTQEQLRILQKNKKADEAYQASPLNEEGVFIDYTE